MFSFTSASVTLFVVAVVVAETPVRENSKLSKQFENPGPSNFHSYLLRPLGGQIVLLQQLQNNPQTIFKAQPQPQPQPQLQPQPEAPSEAPEVEVQEDARNATVSAKNSTVSEAELESARSEKLTNTEDEGVYYIYHPSGLLQKVIYATNDDVEKMAFSASLKYENVEPIKEPIYTYDPETFVFKRL